MAPKEPSFIILAAAKFVGPNNTAAEISLRVNYQEINHLIVERITERRLRQYYRLFNGELLSGATG